MENATQLIEKVEKLETLRSLALRFWYIIFSVPFLTWVSSGDYALWSGIHFSELSIGVITVTVVILGVLLLSPIVIWWFIDQRQQQLNTLFNKYGIRLPLWYVPMIAFWIHVTTLALQVAYEWMSWILWVAMVVVFEWYFYSKKSAYAALQQKLV